MQLKEVGTQALQYTAALSVAMKAAKTKEKRLWKNRFRILDQIRKKTTFFMENVTRSVFFLRIG